MQNVSTIAGANYSLGFDFWKQGNGGGTAGLRVQVVSGGVAVVDQIVSSATQNSVIDAGLCSQPSATVHSDLHRRLVIDDHARCRIG